MAWSTGTDFTIPAGSWATGTNFIVPPDVITATVNLAELGVDSLSATVATIITAGFVATETGADTAALVGTVEVAALMSTQEAASSDVMTANASTLVSVVLAAEDAGSDNFSGVLDTSMTLAVIAVESGSDIASAAASVQIATVFAAVETAQDSFNVSVINHISAEIVASETGEDLAVLHADVQITANLAALEIGVDRVVHRLNLSSRLTLRDFLPIGRLNKNPSTKTIDRFTAKEALSQALSVNSLQSSAPIRGLRRA
jgi:uncharacterized protein